MTLRSTLALLALLAISPVAAFASGPGEPQQPTIAIIIDDMGHNRYEGERLAKLDQPLTLAFLPYRRHTVPLAKLAHAQSKEIMLHAPCSAWLLKSACFHSHATK